MRVGFDTNILVAAFVTEGICARLLKRARERQFLLYVCSFVLDEFRRVLGRKLSATRAELEEAVAIIGEAVHATAEPTETVEGVCRDPDDDNVLACAQAAAGMLSISATSSA